MSSVHQFGRERVAAVIVTFHRGRQLAEAVRGIANQTRAVDSLIVVDNGGDVDALELSALFPGTEVVAMGRNTGPAGGFDFGIKKAWMNGADWIWLFNDDAIADSRCLEVCLDAAAQVGRGRVGMVCPWNDAVDWVELGYLWRHGPKRLLQPISAVEPYQADMVTFNGALVRSDVVQRVGGLRTEFFLGFEEWEYCLRVVEAGFQIWVVPFEGVAHRHAGSSRGSVPPWRLYYQTRNHLAMVLDRRKPMEIIAWLYRQLRFVAGSLLYRTDRWERIAMRQRGALDGFHRRMGRTIDPEKYERS